MPFDPSPVSSAFHVHCSTVFLLQEASVPMYIIQNSSNYNVEYRDGKGDKIGMPCTHSTVIQDTRNSQPKRINDTSPILSQRHTAEGVVYM